MKQIHLLFWLSIATFGVVSPFLIYYLKMKVDFYLRMPWMNHFCQVDNLIGLGIFFFEQLDLNIEISHSEKVFSFRKMEKHLILRCYGSSFLYFYGKLWWLQETIFLEDFSSSSFTFFLFEFFDVLFFEYEVTKYFAAIWFRHF